MADMTDGERIAEERIAEAARTGQDWLDLGDLGLTKLPDTLSKLTKLKRLSLGDFYQVTAEGVKFSERPTKGRPLSDLGVISSLSELRELHIEGTQVSDLTPIKGLLQLQHLVCSFTQVSDLTPITDLLQLQRLNCSNTRVSDLTPITELLQLQRLNCSSTRVSDLTPITELLQLQRLNCSSTRVSDLTPIAGLQQLEILTCNSTKISKLTPIARLQQLEVLTCSGTKVSDLTPIAELHQLQLLAFSSTKISDLTPITGLINLSHVNAERCSIGFIPKSIKNLKKLIVLDLGRNQIKRLPRELGELGALKTLSLYGNPLEDPLPELTAPAQPQATINVLRWLRGEPIEPEATEPDPLAPEETADDPPAIPEQGAGPRVILDQTGRLLFAKPSDLDAKGNDRNRLEALHPALREAAANLIKALQDHPSNLLNERLLQKAEAYRALVDLPLNEVNFARLYGAGMQLLNAAAATREALEAGRVDVPDLTPLQNECLKNIEGLHPPFVLASHEGQQMLEDQTTIKLTANHVQAVKEAGTAFGDALMQRPDLAAPEIGRTIKDAAAEIDQGDNPARDAANAVSPTRNTLTVAAWIATTVSLPVVGAGLAGTTGLVSGGALSLFLAESVKSSSNFKQLSKRGGKVVDASAEINLATLRARTNDWQQFLAQNFANLKKLARVPKFEWLGQVIDWLKRKSRGDKAD